MQVFRAKGLRHPSAGLSLGAGCAFVPNDIELGGGKAPFIILTGPNMGGAAHEALPTMSLQKRSYTSELSSHSQKP